MKLNIFSKLVITVLSVALVIGGFSIYLFSSQQRRITEDIYYGFANSTARSLDASISENDLKDTEGLKERLLKLLLLDPELLAITVNLEQDGKFQQLVSTEDSELTKEALDKDSKENLESFNTNKSRYHKEIYKGTNALSVIVPMHLSGKVVGTYDIVISLAVLNEALNSQTKNIVLVSLVSIVSIILIVLVVARLIILNPLSKLIVATKKIENGDFDIQIDNKTNDEIADLSRAYVQMAQKLKSSYAELEQRVIEKTSELSKILAKSQEQNRLLEDNKGAMINLLEDSRALEEELKVEKESVEKKVIERTNELSKEKAKLISSIEALNRAYILLDLGGNVILTNKQVDGILGKIDGAWSLSKLQEKMGENFNLAFSFKECLGSKKPITVEKISPGNKFLRMHMGPVLLDEKNVMGVLIVVGDVTEEKALERSREEFFSIASHELRTPLTAIRGNASLIKEFFKEKLKDPQLVEMIDDIEESSVRLIDIVNDFLNMGRLEQGRMQFKLEEFDLAELVRDSINQYQVTGSRQKLYLNFEEPKEKMIVRADKERTRQTLINLIGNGIKFTNEGGVTITTKLASGNACIYITDTGRGIPPENQGLLFRKFQQAGSSLYTRDTTKGTGLGLYISKLMIEGMGGKIWLDNSQVDKGTTFAFCLPLVTKKL